MEQKSTMEQFKSLIQMVVAIAVGVVIVLVALWLILLTTLGALLTQFVIMGCVILGFFLAGSAWNDYVQKQALNDATSIQQNERHMIAQFVPLLIAEVRGSARVGVAQLESNAEQYARIADGDAIIEDVA